MKINSVLMGLLAVMFLSLQIRSVAQDTAPVATPGAPVAEDGESETGEGLTVITSDHLLYDYKNAFAVFTDNVVVIDPKLKLTADKLLVRFDEKGDVSFIEAKGQVFIEQDDVTARAEVAEYDLAEGKIVLSVNPLVQRGDAMLTGDKVIYHRNDGRLECFPNARLIIPSDEKGKIK